MKFVLQGDNSAASKDIEAKARDAYDFEYNEVHINISLCMGNVYFVNY